MGGSGIYAWLAAALAAILGAAGLYVKGRKDGRVKSDAARSADKLAIQERTSDVLQKSKTASDDVASASSSDVEQRLRKKYTRD